MASLKAIVQGVEFNRSTEDGSEIVQVLSHPVQIDLLDLQDSSAVLSTLSLKPGTYTGGRLVLASAEMSLSDAPDTYYSVDISGGGEIEFSSTFEVLPDVGGVIALHLESLQVCRAGSNAYTLDAGLQVEADIAEADSSGDYPSALHATIAGKISDLNVVEQTFVVKVGGKAVLVDAASAPIAVTVAGLPGASNAGTITDLSDGQHVRVTGSLLIGDSFTMQAELVDCIVADGGGGGGASGEFDQYGFTSGFGIPSGLTGSVNAGFSVWSSKCTGCHPSPFGAIGAVPFQRIENALNTVAFMAGLNVSEQGMADLAAYLNWPDHNNLPPSPTALNAPANVVASDGTQASAVQVTWSASTGATSYEVWRGASNNSASASLLGTVTSTSYDDSTAVVDTTYYYWVKAVNSVGPSGFSSADAGYWTNAAPTGDFDQYGNTTGFGIPNGLVGNASVGRTLWANSCTACHPSPFGAVVTPTFNLLQTKLTTVAQMSGLGITQQQMADLTAYLNWPGGPIPQPTTPPAPPSNTNASDNAFTDRVRVSWSPGAGANHYEAWRSTVNDVVGAVQIGSPSGSAFDDTGAAIGTTYYYWVNAVNTSGTSDFGSGDTGSRSGTAPTAPSGFNQYGNTTSFSIPSGIAGNAYIGQQQYNLSCGVCHPTPEGSVMRKSYTSVREALSGERAMRSIVLSNQQVADIVAHLYWPASTTRPAALLGVPTGVQASDGTNVNEVTVTWGSVSGAGGYEVWRSEVNDSESAELVGTSATTTFSDTSAESGVAYYFWVKASNAVSTGAFSASNGGYR